jgi:isopenicillin N synthase-like dioxygenase
LRTNRLPQDKLAWDDPRANRGYVKIGRERVTQSTDAAEIAELRDKAPDAKETMEIGRDWDKTWKNHWPQESDAPGFKQTMVDFFKVRNTCFTASVSRLTAANRLAMKLMPS